MKLPKSLIYHIVKTYAPRYADHQVYYDGQFVWVAK